MMLGLCRCMVGFRLQFPAVRQQPRRRRHPRRGEGYGRGHAIRGGRTMLRPTRLCRGCPVCRRIGRRIRLYGTLRRPVRTVRFAGCMPSRHDRKRGDPATPAVAQKSVKLVPPTSTARRNYSALARVESTTVAPRVARRTRPLAPRRSSACGSSRELTSAAARSDLHVTRVPMD